MVINCKGDEKDEEINEDFTGTGFFNRNSCLG
ncbi:hypothetical protein ES708_16002 [subsurface metagenome]